VQHTLAENSFANVIWSKNKIMTFINENTATLLSAPNRIFALGIQPKRLYAFDSATGDVIWKLDGVLPDSMAVHDMRLYATYWNNVQAYNTINGEKDWSVNLPYSGTFTSLYVLDDKIFIYSANSSFFILDSNGQIVKSTGPNYYPMPYVVGDVTYAGNDYGIVAFDTQTGKTLWQTIIEGAYYTGLYFLEDNIYLRTGDSVMPGSVYAINKRNGEILWKNDGNAISNICSLGKNLYFLTWDGYLMILDRQTGSEVARLEFSPRPFILPTAEWRLGGYYVTSDPVNNIVAVSIGDSYQLFALKINEP
jgi:outer membrane protein assembly factor BamB